MHGGRRRNLLTTGREGDVTADLLLGEARNALAQEQTRTGRLTLVLESTGREVKPPGQLDRIQAADRTKQNRTGGDATRGGEGQKFGMVTLGNRPWMAASLCKTTT